MSNSAQSPIPPQDDEINLRQLAETLWRQKSLIVSIAVAGLILGGGASLLSTKHITDGLFLTPGVTTSNYKRYENVFFNEVRLQQYLTTTDQANSVGGQLLYDLTNTPDGLKDNLRPEFAFTDKDQKTFGVQANGEDPGAMIGVHIQFKHKEPTTGTPVILLSEYVRDSIIRVDMEAAMLAQCNDLRTREQDLRNAQIQDEFAIQQEERRATTLREIIARSPGVGSTDGRQIVSLEKGGERFLSPAAQLVATEIQIADMKLAETRRERERISSVLKRDYYCKAQEALQQHTTGRAFLTELKNIHTAVFQGRDKTVDIVEQTWNELDVQRENWSSTYLTGLRFLASPEGNERKERKPGLALGVVLGGLLAGMLGIMIALVRAWWHSTSIETTESSRK